MYILYIGKILLGFNVIDIPKVISKKKTFT